MAFTPAGLLKTKVPPTSRAAALKVLAAVPASVRVPAPSLSRPLAPLSTPVVVTSPPAVRAGSGQGQGAGAALGETTRAAEYAGAAEDGAARPGDREQEAGVIDVSGHREGAGR